MWRALWLVSPPMLTESYRNFGLDFVSLAAGMGVPASRAQTADELVAELRLSQAEPGPHLIHAVL